VNLKKLFKAFLYSVFLIAGMVVAVLEIVFLVGLFQEVAGNKEIGTFWFMFAWLVLLLTLFIYGSMVLVE